MNEVYLRAICGLAAHYCGVLHDGVNSTEGKLIFVELRLIRPLGRTAVDDDSEASSEL